MIQSITGTTPTIYTASPVYDGIAELKNISPKIDPNNAESAKVVAGILDVIKSNAGGSVMAGSSNAISNEG